MAKARTDGGAPGKREAGKGPGMARALLNGGKAWAFWTAVFLLWELTLRLYSHQSGSVGTLIAVSIAAAGVMAALTGLPGWAGRVCGWILPWLTYLLYSVQLVYFDIFGSFLSLGVASMGGDAITAFWEIVVSGVLHCLPLLLLMAVLPAARAIYRCRRRPAAGGWAVRGAIGLACLAAITVIWVNIQPRQAAESVDQWAARYGLLTAEAVDVRQLLSGEKPTLELDPPLQSGGEAPEQYDSAEWNVLSELDLAALNDKTDDPQLQSLNAYFAGQTPTPKHEYTGKFEGYNLIVVCAEAFSSYLIDEELTPTLYRLSHEGFVFNNFYNSFPNLTTNGEYSLNMGLLPDFSCLSFAASIGNYLPFCLGTAWKQTGSEVTRAYHNSSGNFYNRVNSHPNMGYEFKAINMGLDMVQTKPTSDLEMMEKTVDEYIGEEGFMTYYMTYSGHTKYNFTDNVISIQNQALVEGMSGSEELRAYYACQLELERAMAYLVERLEEAGIADKTVIVLTADHMPYGLPEEDYTALAGEAADEPFWKYRNSFICWTGGMEEPVEVDDYCCTQDILPTLLNLFGLTYDSRLLIGRDVLAEGEHVAVLKDGSFLTDGLIYDGTAGTFTWSREPDEEYGQGLRRRVEQMFSASAAVLHEDYYGFALSDLGLGEVKHPQTVQHNFNDLEGKWYAPAVDALAVSGILMGDGRGGFRGDTSIGEAQMLAMVARGLRLPVDGEAHPYTDVKPSAWYYESVKAAWNAGLLPDGDTLGLDSVVTADELRELLTRCCVYLGMDEKAGADWARKAVRDGFAQQRQAPEKIVPGEVSRGIAAYIVAQLIELPDQLAGSAGPE